MMIINGQSVPEAYGVPDLARLKRRGQAAGWFVTILSVIGVAFIVGTLVGRADGADREAQCAALALRAQATQEVGPSPCFTTDGEVEAALNYGQTERSYAEYEALQVGDGGRYVRE